MRNHEKKKIKKKKYNNYVIGEGWGVNSGINVKFQRNEMIKIIIIIKKRTEKWKNIARNLKFNII
jgi:hypothetical protein